MDFRALHSAIEDLIDNENVEVIRSEYNRNSSFVSYITARDCFTRKEMEISVRVYGEEEAK